MKKIMKIKNEAELLSMFCDKNEFRPLLRTPFLNTKYDEVWSAEGHAIIRIKPESLACEYPKGELTFPELECPCKKEVTIEAINEALEACPKIDEEVITQEAIECKECDGEGEVYWEYTDGHGHHHERLYDCPVCDGKGDIRPEIRKETGNQIVDENAIVKVGNAYIYAKYICKLKSAMLHLGVTSVELLFNSERKGNEFAIGDIRITLASMLFDYTCKCNAELKLIEL